MKKVTFYLSALLLTSSVYAQKKCATMDVLHHRAQKDPSVMLRLQEGEEKYQQWIANPDSPKRVDLRIPVVVHVLHNGEALGTGSNISDEQIYSQIERLNIDFQGENADSLMPNDGAAGSAFHSLWGSRSVEFCLAKVDPQGNPTTGITRTQTDSTQFVGIGFESEKFDASGGKNGWDGSKYLNLWVCNLAGTTLGYAAFPTDFAQYPAYDGVVIRHQAFGSVGSAGSGGFTGNNMGRTATHEVGHWLFLRHIWGDNQPNCGDDFVADTPQADEPNFGNASTFSFPWDQGTCDSSQNGQMYMNYMDYPDDEVLVMFTEGQFVRMEQALADYRSGFLTLSTACNLASTQEITEADKFSIYPNPSKGIINFQFFDLDNHEIVITNVLGDVVFESAKVSSSNNAIHISHLNEGVYFVSTLKNGTKIESKRVVLVK